MYPKVGDFVVCSCPSQREGFFKALVVEDRGDSFHTVVLMDLQGDRKPGDSWLLTKTNWELAATKKDHWGTKWRIEEGTQWRIESGN
jgi:hypothetical protein